MPGAALAPLGHAARAAARAMLVGRHREVALGRSAWLSARTSRALRPRRLRPACVANAGAAPGGATRRLLCPARSCCAWRTLSLRAPRRGR